MNKTIKNILLIIAIIVTGCIAAVGILSDVAVIDGVIAYILLQFFLKAVGVAALYVTCRLVAYLYKINDIQTPQL